MDPHSSRVRRLTDPVSIAGYTGDESSSFHGSAEAVVLPRNVDEVCEVVAAAQATRTPLTVSGAGTSITGSRVPDGGIVLSVERLRNTRAIGWEGVLGGPPGMRRDTWIDLAGPDHAILLSPDRDRALVPAGVRLSEIDRLLAAEGRLYPPDPTEMTAMLGGTIATNASGARSYRYGSTRNWIDAL
ncbi:MAG TPA: FAD-binding oxidoreductase, partial [Spirochaetia bacterium]|nr:FAD-binding oxidoreductase [Spirochaetia bacterium]